MRDDWTGGLGFSVGAAVSVGNLQNPGAESEAQRVSRSRNEGSSSLCRWRRSVRPSFCHVALQRQSEGSFCSLSETWGRSCLSWCAFHASPLNLQTETISRNLMPLAQATNNLPQWLQVRGGDGLAGLALSEGGCPSKCRHPKSNAPTPTKQNQRPTDVFWVSEASDTSCRHPDYLAISPCSGFASGLEFIARPHTNHPGPKLRPEEPLSPKYRNPPVMLNPETPKPGLLLFKIPPPSPPPPGPAFLANSAPGRLRGRA